ncbi:MAG: substrate-binding domain-containing protein [Candidatus Dormibacteraeota bacterium]|nr:substrate-binding domain-containing protein [Candidatus Dormibacteraeota bacterium]
MRAKTLRLRYLAAAAALASATLATGSVTFGTSLVSATGPEISGAGSTWVEIAINQWDADEALVGYHVNFNPVGSSTGRQFYIANQVDFAASEIPFQPGQETDALNASGRSHQYVPDVAGGTSLMYNLHQLDGTQVTSLRLDAETAAKIFTDVITSWQDPAIAALNPQLRQPDGSLNIAETTIIPVDRSDGSGTSAQFSLYLASQASDVWNAFAQKNGCPAPCSNWPPETGQAQNGSDGVANFVENNQLGAGSIGYVEAGFAFARAFPIARLKNASGNFAPNEVDQKNGPLDFSTDVSAALKHATLNADLTQNLQGVYTAPETNAYPMSSYSYLVTPTTGFDPAKGAVLGAWLTYVACGGQAEATQLGYSPMPPNLVQDVFDAVHHIPGAPPTPPLDPAHCNNPTLSGQLTFAGGSGGGGGGNGATSRGGRSGSAQASGAAAAAGSAAATGGDEGVTPVPTLDAAEQQMSFVAAEREASRIHAQPSLVLLLAAGAVLLLVFLPALLVSWRAR